MGREVAHREPAVYEQCVLGDVAVVIDARDVPVFEPHSDRTVADLSDRLRIIPGSGQQLTGATR